MRTRIALAALVTLLLAAACTPPSAPAPVDRVNLWAIDTEQYPYAVNHVLGEDLWLGLYSSTGSIVNTATTSSMEVHWNWYWSRPVRDSYEISCTGPRAEGPPGTWSCDAAGSITQIFGFGEPDGGIVSTSDIEGTLWIVESAGGIRTRSVTTRVGGDPAAVETVDLWDGLH